MTLTSCASLGNVSPGATSPRTIWWRSSAATRCDILFPFRQRANSSGRQVGGGLRSVLGGTRVDSLKLGTIPVGRKPTLVSPRHLAGGLVRGHPGLRAVARRPARVQTAHSMGAPR